MVPSSIKQPPPVAAPKPRNTRANARSDPAPPTPTRTQRIVEAITSAIVEGRLPPGTKLVEQRLAEGHAVSRTVVRQALNQLSRDRLVSLEPARGAFVRRPSSEEARQVFEVRALLEGALLRQLCAVIDEPQIARLRAHLQTEAAAVARGDVAGRTRLLADFHVLLADQLGNPVLAQVLGDLLARCSLAALIVQSGHSAEQSQAEHRAIVDALARRDAAAAVALLSRHLGQVERNLRPYTEGHP